MDDQTIEAKPEAAESDGWEWAIIEIMGHRKHAGRIRGVEQFGAKMVRVDIPIKGDPANGWETRLYGGGSIFSVSYSDEATVMKANKPYELPYRISYREDATADYDDGAINDAAPDNDEPF